MAFEVPGYHLLEQISEDSIFRTYRGQRLLGDRPILIKMLKRPHPTPKMLAVLWEEFKTLRWLDFHGVEKAYAVENHQEWWMIVLEDFGGMPLNELTIAGCMDPEDFLDLALQLAELVEGVHSRQVIHKNISPSNIALNPISHQAKLINFGNASLVSAEKVTINSLYQPTEVLPYISPELTGRMNRSVDYRTDYYSLGATLYWLLTGTPPFLVESTTGLVYSHLAVAPEPPAARIEPWKASPTAFNILSAILLKLLAKNPEDRYQSPAGLLADLRQCRDALRQPEKKRLRKPEFIPGKFDQPAIPTFPHMAIGREQESEVLLQAFSRTIGGPVELALVGGEAGVGKTTLVSQLVFPVTERMGLFLYGKCDPGHRLYQSLAEVLEDLCQLILSEPTASFEAWQERLQAAVAPHGQLLIDLCPQLEKIIGPQPPLDPVEEEAARPRLHDLVIRFLQAVCRTEHPVVIFLDDLHWITPDSSLLWRSILSDPEMQNLLVVGSYRDREIKAGHPLELLERDLRAAGRQVIQLPLENLDWTNTKKLIAAILASDTEEISELATQIFLRTEGSPLFTIEFLKSLYKDQLLTFSIAEAKWHWDRTRIEKYSVTSNVVDLYIQAIGDMDEDTQKVLQVAACIGMTFDAASLLAILGQENARSLAYSLWQALMENLIQPLDENYRFLTGEIPEGTIDENEEDYSSLTKQLGVDILFEFEHQRIRQAALGMMDKRQLEETNLKIGRLLLEKAERTGKAAVGEDLFAIVDHLNLGSALLKDQDETINLIQLNLMASNRARQTAAFEAASGYLSSAIGLLPGDCWQSQYSLTLELFTAGAEVALLTGDLSKADALALTAQENARDPLEKARIIETRIVVFVVQNQMAKATEIGRQAIELLGFHLELQETSVLAAEQYAHLPLMTDPYGLAASRLVNPLLSAAFSLSETQHIQFVDFYVDLFTRFGNPPGSSFVYIAYATYLIGKYEQVEQGFQVGKMALEMAENEGSQHALTAVRFLYYAFIHHWGAPARQALGPLQENIQPALEAGNLIYSLNSQDMEFQNSLLTGLELEQMLTKLLDTLHGFELLNQVRLNQRVKIWTEVVVKLMDKTLPQQLSGSLVFENEEERWKQVNLTRVYLFNHHVAQAFLRLYFREPQKALEAAALAEANKVWSHLIYAHHYFYYSLALLSAGLDPSDLAERLEKVEENLRLMRVWAKHAPENFLHQVELVEAEKARCLGRLEEAAEKYGWAIRFAREHGYTHDCALAAELAAEFYLARSESRAAMNHLYTAYYSYLAWGAKAKVEDLINRYPDWLTPEKLGEKQRDAQTVTKGQTTEEITASIDLNTILKTSLELAQETDLNELLCKLMASLIQNAGAQNGSLILRKNDRWYLEVQGSNDPGQDFALISVPLEEQATQAGGPQIPVSMVNYVINSQSSLVLKDASASSQFNQDAYIQSRGPKSILCAPLLNQGGVSGVVYLENNLATGAFTPDRLQIVQLISGQVATSIENARLYEHLEALVEERTQELSRTNEKLRTEIEERKRVEEALRYSEVRYRDLFDFAPDAYLVTGTSGKIMEANLGASSLLGMVDENLADRYLINFIHPDDQNQFQGRLAELAAEALSSQGILGGKGHSQHWEIRMQQQSGSSFDASVTAASFSGYQDEAHSLRWLVRDISARKRAERVLKESEERLRMAMDSAQMAPFEYNFLTGEVVLDERIKALLNGNLVDGPKAYEEILKLVHPDDRQRADQAVALAIEPDGANDFEQEMGIVWPEGPMQWMSIKGKVAFAEGEGQRRPVRLAGIVRDITDQKIAAEALRYNEALLRKVLEILPVGIWITDKNQKIIMGNPEGLRIWAAEGSLRTEQDKYPGIEHEGQYKAWRLDSRIRVEIEDGAGTLAIDKGQVTLNEELEIEAFDGSRKIILNSGMPIVTDEDGLVGAILVNQDITKRKQDQKELQKAHDRLATLLEVSQNTLSILDLDRLLNLILEQLEKVLPYHAAAILTVQQGFLEFQAIRGPSALRNIEKLHIPLSESEFIESTLKERQLLYIGDMPRDLDLLTKIQQTIEIPVDQIANFRSWLGVPLTAKDEPVGLLLLVHSQVDFYSPQDRVLVQAFANQVAIAIHNAQLYKQVHDVAAVEERNRLARELHDSVAQALYSISLFTDATRMALATHRLEVVDQHLSELVQLSREAMSDMRLMIYELRPPILEKDGLATALQGRLDAVESRAGFQADFQSKGEYQLTTDQESELYRIGQEALNNVLKHAQADQVKVRLTGEAGLVQLTVEDNGIGFDPLGAQEGGGQGIRNIQERAAKIGALCRIESTPGEGTKITIEVKK